MSTMKLSGNSLKLALTALASSAGLAFADAAPASLGTGFSIIEIVVGVAVLVGLLVAALIALGIVYSLIVKVLKISAKIALAVVIVLAAFGFLALLVLGGAALFLGYFSANSVTVAPQPFILL